MGATVSRDAETHAHVALTASELALAWRNGAPFAQLQDELYVSEKFHELVRRRGVTTRASAFGDEDGDGERAEATGGDVLSRDELLHMLDVFRLRMLGQAAERGVGSATTPSVRPSKAIVSNERLREERIQLVRTYFEDFAALVSRQAQSEAKKTDATKPKSGDRIVPGPSFIGSDGGLVAGSTFSVGSFRLQLEMLRTFRVMAPELFSNGIWAIFKTVLAFPDFALLGVENDSMDDLFLRDVFEFVQA
ncbi:hypothetical protein Poli38472_005983 [Pythium oligandrum]|uniref:HECT domain-containing protein n=1 Tax=Pythium oligandrum TaxID=41045 RepID=A0A8K1CS33_PYTOL|nr:hypothetical protein Poli38472_005983 [Pythium oligandrum]|eukprot:TMW68515.1 hypothetical protein Poli38472_005983 [Pythium oligandrum]